MVRYSSPRDACSMYRERIWASDKWLLWVLGGGIESEVASREESRVVQLAFDAHDSVRAGSIEAGITSSVAQVQARTTELLSGR